MGVTYREFLASAEVLSRGTDEIDLRNAASRAYYSAFHASRDVSHCCPNVVVRDAGQHEILIQRFKKYPSTSPGHESAKKIAFLLDQARGIRVRADYETRSSFHKRVTETQIHNVKRICKLTEDFKKAHAVPSAVPEAVPPTPVSDDKNKK